MLFRLCVLFMTVALVSCTSATDDACLFNGKDLSGWKDEAGLFSVKDGMIYGSTHGKKLPSNRFLVWDGEVGDFELTYDAKVLGENNSGMMYRAQPHKEKMRLQGNQCDLHPKPEFCGMFYSEATGRGIVAKRGTKVEVDSGSGKPKVTGKTTPATKVDISKWNTFKIVAKGRHIQHYVNGKLAIDIVDNHKEASLKGLIGIQLHKGKPMEVYFKNIKLKKL